MIKTPLAIALIITAVSFSLPATTMAQSNDGVEKVRAQVQILSASKNSQVEVKFSDKTKVKATSPLLSRYRLT